MKQPSNLISKPNKLKRLADNINQLNKQYRVLVIEQEFSKAADVRVNMQALKHKLLHFITSGSYVIEMATDDEIRFIRPEN